MCPMRRMRSRQLATREQILEAINEHWAFEESIDSRDSFAVEMLISYMIDHRATVGDLAAPTYRTAVIGNLYAYETWRRATVQTHLRRLSNALDEPGVGVEPTTPALRVTCSTTELTGRAEPTYPSAED